MDITNRFGHMCTQKHNRKPFNVKLLSKYNDMNVDFGSHQNLSSTTKVQEEGKTIKWRGIVLVAIIYISMFEESGMEVYETIGLVYKIIIIAEI